MKGCGAPLHTFVVTVVSFGIVAACFLIAYKVGK